MGKKELKRRLLSEPITKKFLVLEPLFLGTWYQLSYNSGSRLYQQNTILTDLIDCLNHHWQ